MKVLFNKKKLNKEHNKNNTEREKLKYYLHEKINCFADFKCFGKTTLSEGFPKTTLLLCNLRLEKGSHICQHIWVRADEIINLDDFHLCKNCRIHIEAIPYGYGDSRTGKIRSMKYSIGAIKILSVDNK